jgi:hypothetical protein
LGGKTRLLENMFIVCETYTNIPSFHTGCAHMPTLAVLRSVGIMFQGLTPKTSVSSMSDLACWTPPVSKLQLVEASIVAGSAISRCSFFVKQCRWPGGTDESRFDCEMKNTPGLPLPIPPQKREDTRTRTCQVAVQNLT